jgi:hypothetical protein
VPALECIGEDGIMTDDDYPYNARDTNRCDEDDTKMVFSPTGYIGKIILLKKMQ